MFGQVYGSLNYFIFFHDVV
ncbi:hypothetical protein Golax_010719 [Gossypium laxum]|uniref:Uncharacterized protein n=1 Tax=Gossypium laxum TaxID=34288 RepID=A0A7J8ZIW4_9ROSI|nr:hypothetical protein [Gossypium laxum]